MKNFYNNKLNSKKYFKVLSNQNLKFSKNFIIQNTGLFIGDKAFYKILKVFEILKRIKNVKGHIIEFGVWNGNNLIAIKKMLDFLKINKKVIGYDSFQGMPKADDGNTFKGDESLLKYFVKFFNLSNIIIIKDDIMNLKKNLKKIPKLALIYIDCDTYYTTQKILRNLQSKLSKKGLIVFDEAILGKGGEGKAAKAFYKSNNKKFSEVILKKNYQPDYILEKK